MDMFHSFMTIFMLDLAGVARRATFFSLKSSKDYHKIHYNIHALFLIRNVVFFPTSDVC